ncbi:MAG: hypothetical protein HOV83_14415 [Catenulispora sp.]|nr:hypothetical protein [Catenulispora sp.]
MSEVGSIVVAAIGVGGTLSASVFGQLASARSRRAELQDRRAELADERAFAERRREIAERQTAYGRLLMTSRNHRYALRDVLLVLRDDPDSASLAESLSAARAAEVAHRDGYTEAALTMPSAVLKAASLLEDAFIDARAMIRRLRAEKLDAGDSVDAAFDLLDAALDRHHDLRQAMRIDLGVDTRPDALVAMGVEVRRESRTA